MCVIDAAIFKKAHDIDVYNFTLQHVTWLSQSTTMLVCRESLAFAPCFGLLQLMHFSMFSSPSIRDGATVACMSALSNLGQTSMFPNV